MTCTIDTHRALYAALVTSSLDDQSRPAIELAFRQVPRERFMGPGPWHLSLAGGYTKTPTADPELLYQDVLVALKQAQRLNSGQPSMHARSIAALKLQPGQTVAHIGAGTGYYSAVLSEIVGPDGHVDAFEIDGELADAARRNLADWRNVAVHGDAAGRDVPGADAIYVNAGVTGPAHQWLNAVTASGRMLLPLTDQGWSGGMLLLQRVDAIRFRARFISPVMFIPCVGARDEQTAGRLKQAFANGLGRTTRSLIHDDNPDDSCLFAGSGWWLSSREVD